MPHSLGVVIITTFLLRLQRLINRRGCRRRSAQRLGSRDDVFVKRGVLARGDGISKGIAEDGIDRC